MVERGGRKKEEGGLREGGERKGGRKKRRKGIERDVGERGREEGRDFEKNVVVSCSDCNVMFSSH